MVTPEIVFNGNCHEALEFYKRVFRSEVRMSMPYGEYVPEGTDSPPKGLSSWIMHAEMEIYGTVFWFADDVQTVTKGDMVKLTTLVPTAAEAKEIFAMLAEDGVVTLPPVETFYSKFHATVTDRLGVVWNIIAEEPPAQP